jgi:hypothetical protein
MNVSGVQLKQPDFVSQIQEVLRSFIQKMGVGGTGDM